MPGVRLSDLIASLSLATDLGLGQPQDHVLRQTVIASRLADVAALTDEEKAAAFYVSLLAWVGCIADSHELAHWFGDDTRVRAAAYQVNRAGLPMMRFVLGQLAGDTPLQRASTLGRFLAGGFREVLSSMAAHCEATSDVASRLGLATQVCRALPQVVERWDGRGAPDGLAGERIERVMRVCHIANESEVFWRIGGEEPAVAMLRERRGREYDPSLVDLCCAHAAEIFRDLDAVDAWSVVIEGCAPLDRRMTDTELENALETFADYADLKSPWFTGHSRAVAALSAEAARRAGCTDGKVTLIRRAGLVCRLGTIGVSSGTWNKAGRLSPIEVERVRTVPYLTERVLKHQPQLAEIGTLAGMLHERIDGSGYPRGRSGGAIPPEARLLAAAGVYQSMREPRPHRPALSRAAAEAQLIAEASAGRLDPAAVDAVLSATGHQPRRRVSRVAGLSAREAEVLNLLVRGLSNKQIAAALFITPRTVGSHIEHIYTKTGVTTRGTAAMFAMRHGLVDATPLDAEAPEKIG